MSDLNNALVFKENDSIRTFLSSNFNFILDKDSHSSICWGKTMDEIPDFDPVGPEEVTLYINNKFNFNSSLTYLKKLFNIIKKDDMKDETSISTISVVNILFVDNIYELNNIDDIKELLSFLTNYSFSINLLLNYCHDFTLKDVLKVKTLGFNNIIFIIKNFNNNIIESMNLFLSKNIYVSCNFYVNKNNFDQLYNLFENNYPINTFSSIYFISPYLTKKQKQMLASLLNEKKITIKIIGKNINDYGFLSTSNYDYSLFSCIFDFIDNIVYPCDLKKSNHISMNKLNSISDFWMSIEFEKVRKSMINNIKNDEK